MVGSGKMPKPNCDFTPSITAIIHPPHDKAHSTVTGNWARQTSFISNPPRLRSSRSSNVLNINPRSSCPTNYHQYSEDAAREDIGQPESAAQRTPSLQQTTSPLLPPSSRNSVSNDSHKVRSDQKWRRPLGLALLAFVVILWTASNFLSSV